MTALGDWVCRKAAVLKLIPVKKAFLNTNDDLLRRGCWYTDREEKKVKSQGKEVPAGHRWMMRVNKWEDPPSFNLELVELRR